MGNIPHVETINKILEKSMNPNKQIISKIDYKFDENKPVIDHTPKYSTNRETRGMSFNISNDDDQTLTSQLQNVENIKEYPYIAIGTITVRFPELEKDLEYTCFLIDTNVVVTLASNIIKNGVRAQIIKTTFGDEEVKLENVVHIQGEDIKEDEKKKKKMQKKLKCWIKDHQN